MDGIASYLSWKPDDFFGIVVNSDRIEGRSDGSSRNTLHTSAESIMRALFVRQSNRDLLILLNLCQGVISLGSEQKSTFKN